MALLEQSSTGLGRGETEKQVTRPLGGRLFLLSLHLELSSAKGGAHLSYRLQALKLIAAYGPTYVNKRRNSPLSKGSSFLKHFVGQMPFVREKLTGNSGKVPKAQT